MPPDPTKGMSPQDKRHHELKQSLKEISVQLKQIADYLEAQNKQMR